MNPRLFQSSQEMDLSHLVEVYGIEEMQRVIRENKAAYEQTPPDIIALKPFFTETLQALVNPIVLSVVQGDFNKTKALIKACPLLSSVKGEAIDFSRRTIKDRTPFQAALCAWDNEMCDMLKEYMNDQEVARQYQEIFPAGHENYFNAQMPFDFSVEVSVISQSNDAAIQAALHFQQNNSFLCQTLNQFRSAFTQCSEKEAVFNPKHLMKVFEIYNEQSNHWDWSRRDLFWQQIVGYVQRFLPANIAQGLSDRIEKQEKSKRSFDLKSGSGSIFPMGFGVSCGLGYQYAIPVLDYGARLLLCRPIFNLYFEQKLQSCRAYAARVKHDCSAIKS